LRPPASISASICLSGSELTRGRTRDANGVFLAAALSRIGIRVREIRIVPDDYELLVATFRDLAERSDVVISSGGLGPTADDLTVAAAAEAFGRLVVRDGEARERMLRFALKRFATEAEIPANYFKQAEVLEGSEVFLNPTGLAPGFALATERGIFIVLPGVPRELAALYRERVEPYLRARFELSPPRAIRRKVLGLPESVVEARMQELPIAFERLEYGISARPGEITIELLARSDASDNDLHEAEKLVDAEFRGSIIALPTSLGTPVEEERAHAAYVHHLLLRNGTTLATAESCTGGLVAKRLTDFAGSSAYFAGGATTYSNQAKVDLLGVDPAEIERHGAVSEPVAIAMARGAKERFRADHAISITGIAGPGGGTKEKPVGLVWIALATPDGRILSERLDLRGDRDAIRASAAVLALELLRKNLEDRTPPPGR